MVGYFKTAPKDEKWLLTELTSWVEAYKDIAERNALAETPVESAEHLISLMKEGGWVSPVEHKEALSRELEAGYRLAVNYSNLEVDNE